MTISLCMITKNEEKYLKQCLDSVKDFVDEIIIVDTGSFDKTKQIAKEFNVQIFDFNWIDDFSAARNESLKHATKDWILVLDADEEIEPKDAEKIRKITSEISECSGFSLDQRSYIKNYFEGAFENKSDFEPVKKYPYYISNSIVRLFMNRCGITFKHRIHELAEDSMNELNLKYEKSDIIIHHLSSVKEQDMLSVKTDFYSKIILKQAQENPQIARYNYQAARMFLGQKDYKKALEYFEKTAQIDEKYKLIFSEIAKIYLHMNDKNKAIEYFKKSKDTHPENPSPPNNLAVVLMSMGKFEAAKKILNEAMGKFPDSEPLRVNHEQCLKSI